MCHVLSQGIVQNIFQMMIFCASIISSHLSMFTIRGRQNIKNIIGESETTSIKLCKVRVHAREERHLIYSYHVPDRSVIIVTNLNFLINNIG